MSNTEIVCEYHAGGVVVTIDETIYFITSEGVSKHPSMNDLTDCLESNGNTFELGRNFDIKPTSGGYIDPVLKVLQDLPTGINHIIWSYVNDWRPDYICYSARDSGDDKGEHTKIIVNGSVVDGYNMFDKSFAKYGTVLAAVYNKGGILDYLTCLIRKDKSGNMYFGRSLEHGLQPGLWTANNRANYKLLGEFKDDKEMYEFYLENYKGVKDV